MEKIEIAVGDRVAYKGFYGNVVQLLTIDRCVLRLDSGHLISAPIAELRLIEKGRPPDKGADAS